ncbi:Arm DNA-binding domain-containing protein [Hymenobacter sp. BT730]|uniref:Arm DNA-binding domain-containing protein n=1 Tax=Hymenobacter sp. BT730 TaxID=3063332 RepID=UPI0026DF0D5A|nr:Arm DNA-binding domain-containing protein [Hymenobacter sp. BT730]
MSKTTDHKKGKATVRAKYYTSKTLADGSHPFMLCITNNRHRMYLAIGASLPPASGTLKNRIIGSPSRKATPTRTATN